MKTIEIKSITDIHGHLKIDYQLDKPEKNVCVLILMSEENDEAEDEKLWRNRLADSAVT